MSLSTCLKKAGDYLHPDDKAAIVAQSRALRKQGVSVADAASQAVAAHLETVRGWMKDAAPATGATRAEPLAKANEPEPVFSRTKGIPADAPHITSAQDTEALKAHPDYAAAKAGDQGAAARLVRDLVTPADIASARERIGPGATWVYPHAEEATGRNAIPAMMAAHYAVETDGHIGEPIAQANRVYHTGADAMQRLTARPTFDGAVEPGVRYAIADDVTTMGGTLSEMANHIQEGGGKVVGVVTLANSSRSPTMAPGRHQVAEIERRYGQAVRDIFHVEPAALTRDEATYVLGFKDADALRARVAASARERVERLRAKGLPAEDQVGTAGGKPDVGGAAEPFQRGLERGDALKLKETQSVADTIASKWANAPDVVVLSDMNDPRVPQSVRDVDATQRSQGATGEPAAFLNGGKVYVVASQMKSTRDVVKAMYHESLGHAGLRGVFGDALNSQLDRVSLLNSADVRAKAAEYGLDFSKPGERRQAAEEVLAQMAESRPENGIVKNAVAAVRSWLRDNVPGFDGMKFSDSELVRNFLAPARGFIERGKESAGGDTAFQRTGRAAPAPEEEAAAEKHPLPGSEVLKNSTTRMSELIDHALDETGVYGLVAPMSSGTQRTRAMAQAHINAERRATFQWQRMDHALKTGFDKPAREAMWNAMDAENDIQAGNKSAVGKGIDSLPADQRAAVDTLHAYATQLWNRAKDVGLVTGEGVNYWTPRMMAMVDEGGEYVQPKGQGSGSNITTSAPSAKNRKYETSAETAAAMKAKGGELVRDIRTMPLAMAKFERAIAGRELVNQIKDLGKATGTELVSDSAKPGFFTRPDIPAFMTYKPRMGEPDAQGKIASLLDESGKVIMDKVPLYISNEFKGPLDAIMTTKENAPYRGYMLLKSKAMSAIMVSPLTHNMVIAGRAFSYAGLKLPALYFTGHVARNDSALMEKAIGAGMVPIGHRNQMVDVGDIARGIGKEGGWGDPNESWIGLGAQKLGNMVHAELGNKLKGGIDRLGDFVHGTLLWDRIGDLQAGIFKDAYGKLIAKGLDDNAAATVAAHMANRYAGAVGRENMSSVAKQWANVLLFSRSFNMGNIGAVKDVFYGMPAGLKAQLFEGSSPESAMKAMTFAKRKAFTGLMMDLAATIMVTSIVQDVVQRNKDDDWAKQLGDAFSGYGTRAAAMAANIQANPLKAGSYDPYRLSSTWKNEPDKKDRVDMGAQPGGRHEYMRLPTGKVIEDTIGWATHPGDTFSKKMSPTAKAAWQIATNDKGFGVPVYDPSGSTIQKAMDVAMHLVKSQVPADTIKTGYDMANGKATDLDKEKLSGNLTGLSISQGHPLGPAGAVEQKVSDRIAESKKYVMEAVTRDIKYGDEDRARARLTEIGLTPKEAAVEINRARSKLEGAGPSVKTLKSKLSTFQKHATDEERATMDEVTQ